MTVRPTSLTVPHLTIDYTQGVNLVGITDLHLEWLGPRVFTKNLVMDGLVPVSHRPAIATIGTPLFIDETLLVVRKKLQGTNLRGIEFLGDAGDTPGIQEMKYLEDILDDHKLPTFTFARGNHSSGIAMGVGSIVSSMYYSLIGKLFPLQEEMAEAVGGEENILTAKDTFKAMRRTLHQTNPPKTEIEELNLEIAKTNGTMYVQNGSVTEVTLDESHTSKNFKTFWKESSPQINEEQGKEYAFWECMVNYHLANDAVPHRDSKVPPMYLQAAEIDILPLRDGRSVPIYQISMDSMDTNQFSAWTSNVTEFQIKIVEIFIKEKLKENPLAKFQIAIHSPITHLPKRTQRLFKQLLSQEAIVFIKAGHIHYRQVVNLTSKLKLNRQTPLIEYTLPSNTDYRPYTGPGDKTHPNARSAGIANIKIQYDENEQPHLELNYELYGLDRERMKDRGYTANVAAALESYGKEHGYLYTTDVFKELIAKAPSVVGWHLKSMAHRMFGFFHHGFRAHPKQTLPDYWAEGSFVQNLVDTLVSISTVHMFHEAKHLIPFLQSAASFIKDDAEPGQLAIRARIEGISQMLSDKHQEKREEFEQAFKDGNPFSKLRESNDLFVLTEVSFLAELLRGLKEGSEARAFVTLASLDAAESEFIFHTHKGSDVGSFLKPIRIPINNK